MNTNKANWRLDKRQGYYVLDDLREGVRVHSLGPADSPSFCASRAAKRIKAETGRRVDSLDIERILTTPGVLPASIKLEVV